ncbi:MAG: radical SAM protein [Candidatus Lokiarchaeota archaeon]|nr:radical SAM protein [Candidatus Lokiarchaeota archaeon]
MTLDILLINPNTMMDPPVIPIGLEYLKTALDKQNYSVKILDLCFKSNPLRFLHNYLENHSNRLDIIGITIRNIDTSSFFTEKFFLPEIKDIVDGIKKFDIPVVLGGAGFSALPSEILEYLGADYGIIGPGERAFVKFLKDWQQGLIQSHLYNGWECELDELIHYRGEEIDYSKYISKEGIVGFELKKGCNNSCPYCIEANKPVQYKSIANVIKEIQYLVDKGYNHFHLCDSEFNLDLKHSIEFCESIIDNEIEMKWALYMKPTPYNRRLFKLLHESNAYLITLSVDSDGTIQKLNNYSYEDLKKIIKYCQEFKIKLAIDLLCGYPGESEHSVEKIIRFFKDHRPDTVGITFYYRIYRTPLSILMKNNPEYHIKLTRKMNYKENFLKPIFFANYNIEFFNNLIEGDDLFRIAGVRPGVNYQLD